MFGELISAKINNKTDSLELIFQREEGEIILVTPLSSISFEIEFGSDGEFKYTIYCDNNSILGANY